ncbi:hypothetical protein OUZ56_009098 [Daphnia magna]|uniref:mRNA guanylyltransferase n=1 Tax=Daphnia magna TaxID=35525 RepID=A0ABR0AEZ5_9CRUS|nr:hypothetical protein OUZ56_009098 [Daphnia magna]
MRNQGNSRIYLPQKSRPDSVFTRIEPNTKFLDGHDVEGVHLLTDFEQVRELQVRLGRFSKGPEDFFPVNWPVSLTTENIDKLKSSPYVVAPKPSGTRFLFYVDSDGGMFLENMTQHIFRVDEVHAVKMVSSDGRPVTDTLLDGVLCKEKLNHDDNCNGGEENPKKLTFVIRDAIRCNGLDLTTRNIVKRIDFVKEKIIKPREGSAQNEVFTLDIVEYLEANEATKSYLDPKFEESYKYPIRSFVFFPLKNYSCYTDYDVLQWAENDDQQCSFRLMIPKGIQEPKEAELFMFGRSCAEIKWDETIPLTDEIRNLDGCIVDCRYVDQRWMFVKQRFDRNIPNGKRALEGKLHALKHPVSRNLLLETLENYAPF